MQHGNAINHQCENSRMYRYLMPNAIKRSHIRILRKQHGQCIDRMNFSFIVLLYSNILFEMTA